LISNHFRDSVGGPEKAGVGGSIPSLATNTSDLLLAPLVRTTSQTRTARLKKAMSNLHGADKTIKVALR